MLGSTLDIVGTFLDENGDKVFVDPLYMVSDYGLIMYFFSISPCNEQQTNLFVFGTLSTEHCSWKP